MTAQRFVIWGFEKDHDLNSILVLLNKNYSKKSKYSRQGNEKTLNNKWNKFHELNLNIYEYKFHDECTIQYIPAVAFYEEDKSPSQVIFTNEEETIISNNYKNAHRIPVIFFEYENKIYAFVYTNVSNERPLKSSLMGVTKPRNNLSKEWGKILQQNLEHFQYKSDFFSWVLNHENKKENLSLDTPNYKLSNNYGDLFLQDIDKVAHNREDIKHEGNGSKICEDIITKLGIVMKRDTYKIGLYLKHDKFDFKFRIDQLSQGEILYDSKIKSVLNIKGFISEKDYHLVALFLCIICLGGLYESYLKEIEDNLWSPSIKNDNCENQAIYIIKHLMKKHNLQLEHLGLE